LHPGQDGSDVLNRSDEPFDQEAHLERARREHRFHAAEARIKRIVEGAPPLTAEQRDKLAALLRSA
jgi:plasmid maintenance system antidote protein VapI